MSKFNSSDHRQEYKELFKGFCEQYYQPSTDFQQGPCSMFVNGLFFVVDNTDPVSYCDNIGACGPAQPSDDLYQYLADSNNIEARDENTCNACKGVVKEVRKFAHQKNVKDTLEKRGKELCDYLRTIGEDERCLEVVNSFKGSIGLIDFVLSDDQCVSMNMCRGRGARAAPREKKLPTLADFNNFGIETAVTIGAKPSNPVSDQIARGSECSLCKVVVKEMFNFIRENNTEANIIKGLDRICKLVYPSQPEQDQCQSMVKAYTRELVQLLIDETDPEVICMLIELCTYSKIEEPRQISKVDVLKAPSSDTNDLAHLITALDSTVGFKSLRSCFECKIFIKYLKDKLDNPQSQDELKQWLLDNLCKELPETDLVQSCSEMVETYSATFFKAVVGELNPQTACVELGVCQPKTIVQVLNLNVPTKSPSLRPTPTVQSIITSKRERCRRCTEVVSNLDSFLATQRFDDNTWNKVCENYGAEKRADYMSIFKQHGADIVQMIPTMESPRHLCQQIALC